MKRSSVVMWSGLLAIAAYAAWYGQQAADSDVRFVSFVAAGFTVVAPAIYLMWLKVTRRVRQQQAR